MSALLRIRYRRGRYPCHYSPRVNSFTSPRGKVVALDCEVRMPIRQRQRSEPQRGACQFLPKLDEIQAGELKNYPPSCKVPADTWRTPVKCDKSPQKSHAKVHWRASERGTTQNVENREHSHLENGIVTNRSRCHSLLVPAKNNGRRSYQKRSNYCANPRKVSLNLP